MAKGYVAYVQTVTPSGQLTLQQVSTRAPGQVIVPYGVTPPKPEEGVIYRAEATGRSGTTLGITSTKEGKPVGYVYGPSMPIARAPTRPGSYTQATFQKGIVGEIRVEKRMETPIRRTLTRPSEFMGIISRAAATGSFEAMKPRAQLYAVRRHAAQTISGKK